MRTLLEALFKRRTEIRNIFVLSLLVAIIGNYIATPQYESEGKVLVKVGREASLPPTVMTQPLNVYFTRADQVNTQIQILESRDMVEKALAALPPDLLNRPKPETMIGWIVESIRSVPKLIVGAGRFVLETLQLIPTLSAEQRQVLDFQKRIEVRRVKESEVIRVTFTDPDPRLARLFLDAYMAEYLQASSLAMENPGSFSFFTAQRTGVQQELQQAQQKLIDFRKEWNIYDLGIQKDKTVQALSRISNDIITAELDLSAATGKFKEMEKTPLANVENVLPVELREDQSVVELLKNLVLLKVRHSQMIQSLGGGHPSVAAIDGEMASLRGSLYREALGILKSKANTLERNLNSLKEQLANVSRTAQILDAKGIEMKEYEDQVQLLTKTFYTYSDKSETSRINSVMDKERIGSVTLVQPASEPLRPVSPKRLLNLLLGAVLGLILGVAYALGAEQLSGTVNNVDDLRVLLQGAPVVFVPQDTVMTPEDADSVLRNMHLFGTKSST
ncbi:GumC family protein [Fundidesulfovibrio soli]|uniref:GumC family protein n=1 Tax=Fundidesulfovibrio soli TaxID=2922716 RepID=UPI001FAEE81D|nr:Wzz/FepE/Etk N-terminal domain-containing protein [Fundidesulfovibrio soli]